VPTTTAESLQLQLPCSSLYESPASSSPVAPGLALISQLRVALSAQPHPPSVLTASTSPAQQPPSPPTASGEDEGTRGRPLPGAVWYKLQAFRALNQALGPFHCVPSSACAKKSESWCVTRMAASRHTSDDDCANDGVAMETCGIRQDAPNKNAVVLRKRRRARNLIVVHFSGCGAH